MKESPKAMDKRDNQLIAEFMGWTFIPESANGLVPSHYEKGHDWLDIGQMPYDTSWDWLMPVCAKIFAGGYEDDGFQIVREIRNLIGFVELKGAHAKVVHFIKWFNSQNNGQ